MESNAKIKTLTGDTVKANEPTEIKNVYNRFLSFFHDGHSEFQGVSFPEKKKPIIKPKKIGRNEKCPCGSGLKYKKCCLK